MKKLTLTLSILLVSIAVIAGGKELKIKSNFVDDHCKARIEKEFTNAEGVTDVMADPKTSVVTINYDEAKTDAEKLTKKLTDLGYTAHVENNNSVDSKDIKSCNKPCDKPCDKAAADKKSCSKEEAKACSKDDKKTCTKPCDKPCDKASVDKKCCTKDGKCCKKKGEKSSTDHKH